MKYLLILGLLFFLLWKPLMSLRKRPDAPGPKTRPSTPSAVDDIVPCAHCGVHLPRSDTVGRPGGTQRYCSREHLELGPRPPAA